jgi:hypothetical protein
MILPQTRRFGTFFAGQGCQIVPDGLFACVQVRRH